MKYIVNFFYDIIDNLYNTLIYQDRYLYILKGLGNTIIMAIFATLIGIILGVIIAVVINYNSRSSRLKFLSRLFKMYVGVIRGTPVLLQLMIIYYVIFKSVDVNILLVGILAFGINSSAYVSEIVKSGFISVDEGQFEASLSLGLGYFQMIRYVILPQAFRNIMPSLGNEFITLLKETSVAGYIGIMELTKASDIIASRTYEYFFPLIIVACIYLIMTLGLSKLVRGLEVKLSNVKD